MDCNNKKVGRPKSERPKTKGYRIRLTEGELNALKKIAKENNISISDYIRSLIF